MPCVPFPAGFFPAPPSLPSGVSLPTFTPPIPSAGFCCAIQVPPFGSFPFPAMPALSPTLLAPVVTLINTINSGIQQVYDHLAIPCPTE